MNRLKFYILPTIRIKCNLHFYRIITQTIIFYGYQFYYNYVAAVVFIAKTEPSFLDSFTPSDLFIKNKNNSKRQFILSSRCYPTPPFPLPASLFCSFQLEINVFYASSSLYLFLYLTFLVVLLLKFING